MNIPILESTANVGGNLLKATKPRNFDNVIIGGAYKLLSNHAGNPIDLSDTCYGDINGIEQLMVLNERKSPFDFEVDDIIIVPDQNTFTSISILSDNVQASTQPATVNKQTKQTLQAKTTAKSVAANTKGSKAMQINSKIGKITF